MKRFVIIAALAAGLLWDAGAASAQYPYYRASGPTMTGRNYTMSGHLYTNHNHLTPRPTTGYYSPQYYQGGAIYPAGGYQMGGYGSYYSPPAWNGGVYPGGYGYSGGYQWWR